MTGIHVCICTGTWYVSLVIANKVYTACYIFMQQVISKKLKCTLYIYTLIQIGVDVSGDVKMNVKLM